MDHESMELPIFSSSIAIVLSAAISVVASLIMVTASLCTKQYKDHLAKMAILMLIGDIIFFIPKVVAGQSFEKSETFCRTAAFFIEFGGNSAFFWAPAFAHALYSVAKNERIDILQKTSFITCCLQLHSRFHTHSTLQSSVQLIITVKPSNAFIYLLTVFLTISTPLLL